MITSFLSCSIFGQDISLYKQFNGRYDFVFFGNTLNKAENGTGRPCEILKSSAETLSLNPNDVIESAYLYWAGSGSGDLEVKLNGIDIKSERNYNVTQATSGLVFFSAFADVTAQVQATGNGLYEFSDLDLTNIINGYCGNGTNLGGWAIIIVYKNPSLTLNQVGIYDGLQYVPTEINIKLDNLNVIDNQDAKIGFLAWEGDRSISENETLRINGNPIGNPPLNPVNNAFNGTNSFTGSTSLYNMDLDYYNVQNNINIGDASANINLTSGRDFVMINAIVTKFNSQLPDATIKIDKYENVGCDSRKINVDYTVYNLNSTENLNANTPIAIYANGILIKTTQTNVQIPVGGSENGTITLLIPDAISADFDLKFVVDDLGTGIGIVNETIETNNVDFIPVSLWFSPKFNFLSDKLSCNEGLGRGVFDFADYEDLVKVNLSDVSSFYGSKEDAENKTFPILNSNNFTALQTPKTIFVRIENEHCFSITSFLLITQNCPPIVHNYISANGDAYNPVFYVEGLRDIFLNFKTSIYNRWGALIWDGNNNSPDWDGFATKGILLDNQLIPAGTYYYIIELNDANYPSPLVGYLYLTK